MSGQVLYGPAYLDADQRARQAAMVAGAPATIYGKDYLPSQVVDVEPPEPPQYTIAQLKTMLDVSGVTVDAYQLALKAESYRATGPRKGALVLLQEAATALGKADEADVIGQQMAAMS